MCFFFEIDVLICFNLFHCFVDFFLHVLCLPLKKTLPATPTAMNELSGLERSSEPSLMDDPVRVRLVSHYISLVVAIAKTKSGSRLRLGTTLPFTLLYR